MTTINDMNQRLKIVNMINRYNKILKVCKNIQCLSSIDIINCDQTLLPVKNNKDISAYVNYNILMRKCIEHVKTNIYDAYIILSQCTTNEECQNALKKYLSCYACNALITALSSNTDFDKYVINVTSNKNNKPKITYDLFVNIPNINSRGQLLKIVKELALINKISIIGSATIDTLSGIDANNLDIVADHVILYNFITLLECFFIIEIKRFKEDLVSDAKPLFGPKYVSKFQITHDNINSDINLDVNVNSQIALNYDLMFADFEATSFILSHKNGEQHLETKTKKPISDILFDVKNKILRIAPQDLLTNKSIRMIPRLIYLAFKKQAAGWIMPNGIPMNVFEHIAYAITNKELMILCDNASFTKLPNVIWKIIVEYQGHCSDNYKKRFYNKCGCGIDEYNNSLSRDYLFIHPCCKRIQCITCAMKEIDIGYAVNECNYCTYNEFDSIFI